jgi:hypothetical protein
MFAFRKSRNSQALPHARWWLLLMRSFYICTDNPDIFGIAVAVKKINTKGDSKIESQVRRVISLFFLA